jgi:4-hydroxy-tetrahydrodipicolinate reductase
MKIALLGFGKMGRKIEEIALQKGHEIVCKISSQDKAGEGLQEADLCIDFSHAEAILEHVEIAISLGKNLVIGTTGWNAHLSQVCDLVKNSQIGLLYSSNFSVGMHIFRHIVAEAAHWANACEEYDIALQESHHQTKSDSPSGTALALADLLLQRIKRKNIENLSISSSRCGDIPGTHTLILDSPIDTLTLTHVARKRDGFAAGAIKAAEWLQGRQGVYTFEDIFV